MAFTNIEINILKEKIPHINGKLWLFVQIMYYTLARPNEIRQLKKQNILFESGKVFIPAQISKNGKDRWPVIPQSLIPALENLCENKVSGDFLFPGQRSGTCIGKNRMSEAHKNILIKLEISTNCTLYSWKHTGVVQAYKSGVDIKAIQMQCGHYSIIETDTYLKSLHLYENDEFKMKMPEL